MKTKINKGDELAILLREGATSYTQGPCFVSVEPWHYGKPHVLVRTEHAPKGKDNLVFVAPISSVVDIFTVTANDTYTNLLEILVPKKLDLKKVAKKIPQS